MPDNAVRHPGKQSRKSSKAVRTFSPAVADALTKAMSGYNPESPESDDALRAAIVAAAEEARAQAWRPEELIIALQGAVPESVGAAERREPLKALLKRRGLVAYFGQHEGGT